MDFNEARRHFEQLRSTTQPSLLEDLVETAIRYARLRVDWLQADSDRRALMESDRTMAHNALITCCDILARNMQKHGEDIRWREALGADRKVIGDFACYIHCLLGIRAR